MQGKPKKQVVLHSLSLQRICERKGDMNHDQTEGDSGETELEKEKECGDENFILQCASYSSANMRFISSNTSCKPKISNFWIKIFIKKYIAAFYVSVNNLPFRTFMKICKALSYPNDDPKSILPA